MAEAIVLVRADDPAKKPLLYACGKCGQIYSPRIYVCKDDVADETARRAAEDCYNCRTHNNCQHCGKECEKHWLAHATVAPTPLSPPLSPEAQMSEPSKMHNGWPAYFAAGHAIQRCDATTGHTVSNVAYCDTPERASELAKAHERAEKMASVFKVIQCLGSSYDETREQVRRALSAWEANK